MLRNKVWSLLGLAPLGAWTLVHLWNNLAGWQSGEAWQRAVTGYPSPTARALTYAIVLVPLVIHAAWGVVRLPGTRVAAAGSTFSGVRHVLHRLSALGVLLFLGAHLWLALLRPRLTHGGPEPFADLAREMRFHLPTLAVYVLGVLGTAYHLANGVQAVQVAWLPGRWGAGTMDRLTPLAGIVFALALAMGWGALGALWRAGGLLAAGGAG